MQMVVAMYTDQNQLTIKRALPNGLQPCGLLLIIHVLCAKVTLEMFTSCTSNYCTLNN